jgi:AcrR family transcriptional regulator
MNASRNPSKGEQTRTTILDEALKVASKLGLEGLTIGSLAEATGMSKSGLFAHFGSREDLQLAVLEHAAQRYGETVLRPALQLERGLPRLRIMFERWLDWAIASGLPGGCIMIAAAAEYDDRPGPIRDAVIANQHRGNALMQKAVRLAVEEGHLRDDTDPEQIAFELLGIVLATHNHRRLLGDREARKRALVAFEQLVARYATRQALKPASAHRSASA